MTTECDVDIYVVPYKPPISRFSSGNDGLIRTLRYKQSVTSKARLEGGNPYIGMASWEGLSLRQKAILAALGVTRRAVR